MTRTPTRAVTPLSSATRRPALSIVAAGIALSLGTFGIDAAALSLGRLNVLSSLGEPLRAEIELSDVTAAEADGLRVRIPSAEAFRAIGVPYNTALADVQATVQRRANGRYIVQLTSSRQMAEPFIDVLLEANGSSGRVFRDYTVLIDPPGARPTAPAPAVAAAPTPRPSSAIAGNDRASSAPTETRPRPTAAPVQRPAAAAPSIAPAPAAPVERPAPSPAPATARSTGGSNGSGRLLTVRPGDTASRIANAVKPAEISLDQMLVALLRANPDAFMEGNLNRVRAGAVMEVPDAAQAAALSPQDARRAVIAQSRDFGDYRRQLAENAPVAGMAPAGRQTSGRLQSDVEARAPAAPADRLTLAPGGVPAAPTNATAPQSGIGGTATSPAGTPAGPIGAGAPGAAGAASTPASASASATSPAAVAASGAALASTVPPSPAASGTTGTGTGAATVPPASATSAPTVRAPVPAAVAPEPDETWYEAILANPLALGGLGLIGLLIAWLAFRLNSRRRRDAADSVFLESNVPRDSFFAASGGESVDTRNRSGALASSLSYSPSHVDAADVDPVAEADVYLAYGRDLQAEEILREALKINPERVAIHVKLLEIHAKRRDVRAYEALADDVRTLTGGTGSDWTRVLEMGRELDPGNPAYEAGGRPGGTGTATAAALAASAVATALAAETMRASAAPAPAPMPFAPEEPVSALPPVFTSQAPAFVPSVAPLDFDLDLYRPDHVPPAVATPAAAAPAVQQPVDRPRHPPLDTTMPMPLATPPEPNPPLNPFMSTMPHPPYDGGADHPLTIDLADFDTTPAALETPPPRPAPPAEPESEYATLRADLPADTGLIDFDLRDLSQARTPAAADTVRAGLEPQRPFDSDPQSIKLSLARELQAMGDIEGARSLIEEVEAESSGQLRQEAQRMLGLLG
jgi:pilus assembly protein FimV